MYPGLILCILSGLMILLAVFCMNDKRVDEEIMAFLMTIQMIGLIRMRAYKFPYIDLSWTLFGFSQL